MLKTSLLYLIIGIIIGLLMFLPYQIKELSWTYNLRVVHTHLILVGFVIQMIMGVALWMFPQKPTKDISIEKRFTSESEGMLLYVVFNLGIVLRSSFEPFARLNLICFYISLLGVILQILAIFYFLTLIYPRIRKPGEFR